MQEERNFRFHLCAAFYAFVAAFWAELDPVETALIALCVAAVLALELVNSAIERAVDKPDTTTGGAQARPRIWPRVQCSSWRWGR